MSIFNKLELIRKNKGAACLALIDPESDIDLVKISLNSINQANFDAILFGGSYNGINKKFNNTFNYVKKHTSLPIILFPGSAYQVSQNADAILFLNLISGRNPKYLIEEQVKSSKFIYNINIESIPTAYIVLNSDRYVSSVSRVTHTKPLDISNIDLIISHCLAGQYMGNKFLYLEMGSGAKNHICSNLLKTISEHVKIPIIIGGGIDQNTDIQSLVHSGAGYIVIGTLIEKEVAPNILNDEY